MWIHKEVEEKKHHDKKGNYMSNELSKIDFLGTNTVCEIQGWNKIIKIKF